MAHKIHVDVLDVNNNVITSIRNYACDSGVRPINYRNGVIWKRYIEIDKCIYSPKELRAWCRFVSALGFKCSFSSNQVEIEIENKKTRIRLLTLMNLFVPQKPSSSSN